MSFLKSLFGLGGSKAPAEPVVDGEEEFDGYLIKAKLMRVGSEFQIAGSIEKEIDGELKVHEFIRADKFSNKEDAVSATLAKGQLMIKQMGRTIFSD